MGFFSWITSDTNKPIINRWHPNGPTPCKMIAPDGREWEEHNYDGYGVFGDKDYYVLVAELNNQVVGDINYLHNYDATRDRGIKLAFEVDNNKPASTTIMPKIVSIDFKGTYKDVPETLIDPNQGYFIDEMDEDFWDCECTNHFSHAKTIMQKCHICGAKMDDQPDSLKNEMIKNYGADYRRRFGVDK